MKNARLTQAKELKASNYFSYNEQKYIVNKVKNNPNNKQFIFIYTTCNTKIELPKEYYINIY